MLMRATFVVVEVVAPVESKYVMRIPLVSVPPAAWYAMKGPAIGWTVLVPHAEHEYPRYQLLSLPDWYRL
jgi:hypothetical protein